MNIKEACIAMVNGEEVESVEDESGYYYYRHGCFHYMDIQTPEEEGRSQYRIPDCEYIIRRQKITKTVYLNINEHNINTYMSNQHAQTGATPDRLACIPVEISYYEGEGL